MSTSFFNEFFVNFCILCTGLFIIHHIFRSYKVTPHTSFGKRTLVGVIEGLFGTLLMHYGIHLDGNVLIDLRGIPIMVAAIVGGGVSSIISAVLILSARLVFYPYSASAVLNACVLLVAGISFGSIGQLKMKYRLKWVWMAVVFIVLIGATIGLVIPNTEMRWIVFTQYSLAILCACFTTQFLLGFLWRGQKTLETFKELSQTDYLTGLNNARMFAEEIHTAFQTARGKGQPLSVLVIDIDFFKQINDTYGHPVGDEVLRELGRLIIQSCRVNDFASRNGGEEFTVILQDCDMQLAQYVAERIRHTIESHAFVVNGGMRLHVTVSIGLATTQNHSHIDHVEQLIQLADEELYAAKRAGRNQICPPFVVPSHYSSHP